jgi:hypothetical protein
VGEVAAGHLAEWAHILDVAVYGRGVPDVELADRAWAAHDAVSRSLRRRARRKRTAGAADAGN